MDQEKLTGAFNDETAADRPDLMTDAEYAAAYAKMAKDYFSGREPQKDPELLYVTGLPGAGKSSFVGNVKKQPETKDHIVINFDDLRIYHPRYAEHVRQDPVNAAARIDKAVEGLIGWLCEEAAKRKINTVLDDAAMGGEMTKMVLSPFQAQGYSVQAVIVAVPSLVARQSVHLRFEKDYAAAQKGNPVLPRWVNSTEQDNAPAALVETVETLEEGKLAGKIIVMDRDLDVLYSTENGQAGAAKTVRAELTRELSGHEIVVYQDNAAHIAGLMEARMKVKKTADGQAPAKKICGGPK